VPIVLLLGGLFLAALFYLIDVGFGSTGSVFGKAGTSPGKVLAQQAANTNIQGGGPPPAVVEQLKTLRDRIVTHPNDDVAITQLADIYLTVNKFADAIPLYERALKVNPKNVAAQTGLEEAKTGLAQAQGNR
jgi:cytochrome c-type biogenesis protein CcmH/NrfG